MQLVIGHTSDPFSSSAAADIVDQCRQQLAGRPPVAGILFAAIECDHEVMLGAIMDAFGELPLIGCTTDGELSSSMSFQEDSVVLALFVGEGLRAGAGIGLRLSADPAEAAARAVRAASLEGIKPGLCVALPESLTVSAVSVVQALSEALPPTTPLVGGTSGDQWKFEGTRQFFGREVHADALPILMLYGDFDCGIGVASGWEPVGAPATVDRVEGNVVFEIGGVSALEYYRRYFGAHVQPNPEYPLEVLDHGRSERYLRAPLLYDEANGSVTYAGDVPIGSRVQLTTAPRDAIVDGCRASVERALQALGRPPQAAMIVSCAARKQLLGTTTGREHETLRTALGDVPVFGFYSYGEIAPIEGRAVSDFHNETFVTVLFGQ